MKEIVTHVCIFVLFACVLFLGLTCLDNSSRIRDAEEVSRSQQKLANIRWQALTPVQQENIDCHISKEEWQRLQEERWVGID